MATGDNILTAIHVGRECGIINNSEDVLFGDLVYEGDNEILTWRVSKSKESNSNSGSPSKPSLSGLIN